jgi:hypothetical protein
MLTLFLATNLLLPSQQTLEDMEDFLYGLWVVTFVRTQSLIQSVTCFLKNHQKTETESSLITFLPSFHRTRNAIYTTHPIHEFLAHTVHLDIAFSYHTTSFYILHMATLFCIGITTHTHTHTHTHLTIPTRKKTKQKSLHIKATRKSYSRFISTTTTTPYFW